MRRRIRSFLTPPPLSDPQAPVTSNGQVERRKIKYVTEERFKWWRQRAVVAFAFVAIASTGAAYLGYNAGESSTRNLATATASSSAQTCLSGSDLRIANAQGLDSLRRAALKELRVPEGPAARFMEGTQPGIDRLLSQAAGKVIVTDPPAPFGVKQEVVVRRLAMRKCAARSEQNFGQSPDPPPNRR